MACFGGVGLVFVSCFLVLFLRCFFVMGFCVFIILEVFFVLGCKLNKFFGKLNL